MPAEQPPLVLKGGALFDSAARSFRAPADILCREGRIAQVAPSIDPPLGASVIDCSGRYVLPGLIDCHVHITASGDPSELNNARGELWPCERGEQRGMRG